MLEFRSALLLNNTIYFRKKKLKFAYDLISKRTRNEDHEYMSVGVKSLKRHTDMRRRNIYKSNQIHNIYDIK